MSADRLDAVVLHVALEPITGVWSVMRDLALAQSASRRYAGVGIGVVSSPAWPDCYVKELGGIALSTYRSKTLRLFGTAQFLWQRLQPAPINQWVEDLMKKSEASQAIVHFHNAWMSGVFLPVGKADHGTVRTVATMHGMFASFDRKPVRLWLHRWMASRLTRYHARLSSVDRPGALRAERLLGIHGDRFTVIHNGVVDDHALRANAWKGDGVFRFGYLGNLEERKGWEIGVQAALELTAQAKHVRYIVAGGGPQSERARAWHQRHPDIVEYIGYVNQPRRDYLPKLHALALMSSNEGLPMAIVEALSVGLPVIATQVGGVAEAFTHNINGLFVTRDSEALKKAVLRLYDQPKEHFRLGAEGRLLYLQKFELRRILQDYHNLYLRSLQELRASSAGNNVGLRYGAATLCD